MEASKQCPKKQAAVTITEFGNPDVLKYQTDVALPEMGGNQVLIKVAYASVNPVDYKTRQGKGWGADNIKNNEFANNQPAILGFDVAGEIIASNADGFKVGDRVAALNFAGGCYAEYNTVDANLLANVPDGVDLKTAGALPCVGTTAYQVVEYTDIKDGEHVVMSAPAGGVGHVAIQLLMQKVEKQNIKLTVICSPEKYEKLKGLIDVSKLNDWIDYTKEEAFPDMGADVLLDFVGNDAGVRALSVLKQNGRVIVLPSIWVDKLQKAGNDKNLEVKGFKAEPNGADLNKVLEKIDAGELTLKIQKVYPLAQTAEAHREIEKGNVFGKLVLEV